MRHHKELGRRLFTGSLVGSMLLTFALLSCQSSVGEARAIATYNNLNNDSPYWKRSPQERQPHSPYTNPNTTPGGELQSGDGEVGPVDGDNAGGAPSRRKRSLFSHVNDDIVVENIVAAAVAAATKVVVMVNPSSQQVPKAPPSRHVEESTEGEEEFDRRERALIEPQYPSIDLFDEDEEIFEVGNDGILREPGMSNKNKNKLSSSNSADDDENERRDGAWMVDEWEEELEGDMDELMDWIEEDQVLNRLEDRKTEQDYIDTGIRPSEAKVMGSRGLRDQESIHNVVKNEDEESPFQRLFVDSWLF
ncbi:hypothetical protein BG011_006461 [Mortierella polycephala]|uniref:Uncharacterized protein n=1 Tax=Mortierella polycephala TaxID=41804 RepID=A0A9P6U972_9FUNG|nr:hypothetical protein BG011_006461 [Mortierella polycephala]